MTLMAAYRRETEEADMPVPPSQPEHPAPLVRERHGYRPSPSNRWIGLAGTMAIFGLVLAALFFTITRVVPVKSSPALAVFDVQPPAAPAETPPEKKEAPMPVEKKEKMSEPFKVQPVERTIVPIAPVSVPVPVVTSKPVDPAPVQSAAAAPKTLPAPPAPRVASNGPDTWESRVLLALNKAKRYPRSAMFARQQGVPLIRFVMDRSGKVLSSRLEHSSGFPDLDREAVALPKRASPLPKPPDDKPGDTLELVVPVEFFLRP